jgi:hypothetical protein
MNRRDFVVYGTAAAAGVGVARFADADVPESAGVDAIQGSLPYKVIFDARFRPCRSFAHGAAQIGCAVQPVTGDVTALWFNDLQRRWAQRKETVVGMTTCASLLCLEQLAWDQWMRVVARVEHRPEPDGTVRHRLFLHSRALKEARLALAANAHWAERMAAPLVAPVDAEIIGKPAGAVVFTQHELGDAPRLTLVSWVIAARSSAGSPSWRGRPRVTEEAPL